MKVCLDKVKAVEQFFETELDFSIDETSYSVESFKGSICKNGNFFELTADIKLKIIDPCDRCLKIFTEEIKSNIHMFIEILEESEFLEEEKELTDDEMDIYFINNSTLDLDEVIKQEAVVLRGYKRICHEDCKGICPGCGEDLNESECKCKAKIDSRWQALSMNINKNQ